MARALPCPMSLSGANAGFEKFGPPPTGPAIGSRAWAFAYPSRSITRTLGRLRTSTNPDTHSRRAGAALDRLQVALESLPEEDNRQHRQTEGPLGQESGSTKPSGVKPINAKELLESIKTSSSLAMAVPFIALPLVPFGSISLSPLSSLGTALSGGFAELSKNYVFSCGFVGWFCAQGLKIFTKWYKTGTFDPMAFFDSGGMPSSHSSLCAAMTTAVAIHDGLSSSLFAACTCFTVIVMYDAMGVRRHAGLQAQVLNAVVDDLLEHHPVSGGRKLKEVLGHTPRQVMMGGLLGMLIGLVFPH